jgi:hypothetical protein
MSAPACTTRGLERCAVDGRRAHLRASSELTGIDYVEVYPDRLHLCVHFFGAAPAGLDARRVVVEGGARIRDIAVLDALLHEHEDGDVCLLVTVDKPGDFSQYCVCLIEPDRRESRCSFETLPPAARQVPKGVDPQYACAPFFFRIDCASTVDCAAEPSAAPRLAAPPLIDYLARDYDGFHRLILDRLAQTMPAWREIHAPDIGITIVELLAYVADHFSYQLDAIASEAFLRTARRRISVRRHARLVDYWMHEGRNARAWITIESDGDFLDVPLADLRFATRGGADGPRGGVLGWDELESARGAVIFEPIPFGGRTRIDIRGVHSRIEFYTWEGKACCLPAGSTRATLRDAPVGQTAAGKPDDQKDPKNPNDPKDPKGEHQKDKYQSDTPLAAVGTRREEPRLHLSPGGVLIFEEVRGCQTGSGADADPGRRHVVRLTQAAFTHDPLTKAAIWEIEWDREDALPFELRLSVRMAAPDCSDRPAAVARGNVVLVDHGVTVCDKDTWVVGTERDELCCVCDGGSVQQRTIPERLTITLAKSPITHAEPIDVSARSARALGIRDTRAAVPAIALDTLPPQDKAEASTDEPASTPTWPSTYDWTAVNDLLASGRDDRHVAVEIDDEGLARIRFGEGVNGYQPAAGWRFRARYRVGNGVIGNVGRDSITWIALRRPMTSGTSLRSRNPLAAEGGLAPESIESAKRDAPQAYTRVLERAVAAADYARIAERDPRVQGAVGELTWTGSWYEATVALDALAAYAGDDLAPSITGRLDAVRRIAHDLRVVPVRRVPLDIGLSICVLPGHLRGDVERAIRQRLSSRTLPDGSRGLFHPDEARFGEDVSGSRVIAAVQSIAGVAHVELSRFARLYDGARAASISKADNVISIDADELAVLDGDANVPERGHLSLALRGGR